MVVDVGGLDADAVVAAVVEAVDDEEIIDIGDVVVVVVVGIVVDDIEFIIGVVLVVDVLIGTCTQNGASRQQIDVQLAKQLRSTVEFD